MRAVSHLQPATMGNGVPTAKDLEEVTRCRTLSLSEMHGMLLLQEMIAQRDTAREMMVR